MVTDIPRGAFAQSGTEVPTTMISLRTPFWIPLDGGTNQQNEKAPDRKSGSTEAVEQFALF